ncbi:DUF2020 domain-containing protein [Corynebacterium timonense]|uniref:UPF0176 protein n=1 Tax=Corynebacterium timonense TaxID=441500 RepID=A0A1H1UWC4_9CORY|nr:DUF2020 domain-containing protein [Corynebacterium timonense]SDS76878.1 UPF0176 protein [Corynebacterium timonense]
MRITLPTACAAALLLAGCSAGAPEPAPSPAPEPAPAPEGPPHDAAPAAARGSAAACPYLDTQWVAETNGQRVTDIGVDERFDPPACQFWSYQEEPQLTVLVRHMPSPEEAMAVVDWAAPIDATEPADQPAGWNGGRAGGGAVPGSVGAVYAVAKGPVAVSVWTNQNESVKAQAVAEQVIAALGL